MDRVVSQVEHLILNENLFLKNILNIQLLSF